MNCQFTELKSETSADENSLQIKNERIFHITVCATRLVTTSVGKPEDPKFLGNWND